MICDRCGLVWSDPFPYDPRRFYEDDYRVSYKGAYSPKAKHVLRAGNVALSRYRKIAPILTESRVILDVGTGGGEFAYLLRSIGHDVHGIEPNKGYAEYSIHEYGLDVQIGFVQDIVLPADTFDVITIWHVLEHTENPYVVLEKLHTTLKPGGLLVIEVPNVEATCQSPRSTFHEAHLFNFNVANLSRLAHKASFIEQQYSISPDGGNITMFFRKASNCIDKIEYVIPGNAERIISTVRHHTPFRHYLSCNPYARLFRRIRQSFREKRGIRDFEGGRQLLDQLYLPLHSLISN